MVSLECSCGPACHPQTGPGEQAQAASFFEPGKRIYACGLTLLQGTLSDRVESKPRLPAQSAPGIRSTSVCIFMTLLSTKTQEN